MSFLLFIFLFILIIGVTILSLGVSLVKGIGSFFFGKSESYASPNGNSYTKSTSDNTSRPKKIFQKEEGEYVRYEEIKD